MWRFANYIYRAFRTVATHHCPQDIIVPVSTIFNKDDQTNREEKQEDPIECKSNKIHRIIKTNQFSPQNFDKLQENLYKISLQQLTKKLNVIKPIEPPKLEFIVKEVPPLPPSPPIQKEETLDSLLQADETCMNTLKSLSDLNEETMSTINNQLAIEAIESGDAQFGIETLKISAKDGKNAAALFNLGVCYEQGIGVEHDRAKACDYYRQAAMLGHTNAQINLTLLSNCIDINDKEDEKLEQTITNKSRRFHFSFAKEYKEEQWSDYQLNFTKTLACL